jgi:hypothetical protein
MLKSILILFVLSTSVFANDWQTGPISINKIDKNKADIVIGGVPAQVLYESMSKIKERLGQEVPVLAKKKGKNYTCTKEIQLNPNTMSAVLDENEESVEIYICRLQLKDIRKGSRKKKKFFN